MPRRSHGPGTTIALRSFRWLSARSARIVDLEGSYAYDPARPELHPRPALVVATFEDGSRVGAYADYREANAWLRRSRTLRATGIQWRPAALEHVSAVVNKR